MMHQLVMPLALPGLQIDADQRFCEQIVALAVPSVKVSRRRLDGQISEPQFFIHGELGPHAGISCVFRRFVQPCLVTKLSFFRDGVEDPKTLASTDIKTPDVSFVVAHALRREPFAKRRAYDDHIFGDHGGRLEADLADYLPEGTDPADVRISPLRALHVAGLPPAIIHTAEFDPMRDEGNAYARKLLAAGVAVEHVCHDGMIHNFHAMSAVLPQARLILSQIGEQVRRAVS